MLLKSLPLLSACWCATKKTIGMSEAVYVSFEPLPTSKIKDPVQASIGIDKATQNAMNCTGECLGKVRSLPWARSKETDGLMPCSLDFSGQSNLG